MTRESAIARAERHFDDGTFINDLARRVAVRSESQVPEGRPYLDAYLRNEIMPSFQSMGFKADILPNPVAGIGPVLLAERIESPSLPTVLLYGHGDVTHGQDSEWREGISPWVLKQEGDRYYGRGSADNKGQHSVNMAALAAVIAERGQLGFNAKFMIETAEEVGSPGLRAFCEQHKERLAADVLIASDAARLTMKRPTLFLGSRGGMTLRLTVELRQGAHHSGNWGGLLANPGIILSNALASIVSRQGKLLVRGLVPDGIPDWEREALLDCAPQPEAGEPQIDAWWGEPGLSAAEKVFAWNNFEVLSIHSGPENPQNAIPGKAVAICMIKCVAGCKTETFIPILRHHLDSNGFDKVKIGTATDLWKATHLNPDHPWVRWAADSVRRTTGVKPAILPSMGASVPNDCFSEVLGLPTVWVPHSYRGCSQHAPNEHALAPILREGLQMMTGLFWDLPEFKEKP